MTSKGATPTVNRSVRRIFDVAEALVASSAGQSATEIASRTGYAYTTVVADLKSLQGLGYVSFDLDSRTYMPTFRFTLLAGSMTSRARLASLLRSAVDELAVTTRETAILWQCIGPQMQAMHVAMGQEPLRMVVERGLTYDVERSGSGRAWTMACVRLAIDVPGSRAREVQRALKRGYAVAYDELVPHVGSIAVPLVLAPEGSAVTGDSIVAISVGGVEARIRARETEIAAVLRRTVDDLRVQCLRILRAETR